MTNANERNDGAARLARPRPLLEVIALTPADAVAAERGGADRLEAVSAIATGGLTLDLDSFRRIRGAVDLPLRVMLRSNAGFEVTRRELDELCQAAAELRAAGADQFVFGFLDADGRLDEPALEAVIATIAPCYWTLHHAFDHARDIRAAWETARNLSYLDCILSGGVRGDLGRGLETLRERAAWQSAGPRWLAGGGLVLDYVEPLRRAGITMFHIGRAAREDYSWERPVSVEAVHEWREALDRT